MKINQIIDLAFDKRIPPRMFWTLLNQNPQKAKKENNNTLQVCWTVDVENLVDNDPKIISQQVDDLTKLFKKNKIVGTFFVQGEIVNKIGQSLVNAFKGGNEIGLHGYTHDNWGDAKWFLNDRILTRSEKENFLDKAVDNFKSANLPRPTSFRAPNLSINVETLKILHAKGFDVDSSYGSFLGEGAIEIKKLTDSPSEIPVTSPKLGKVQWKKSLPFLNYQMLTLETIINWSANEAIDYVQNIIFEQKNHGINPTIVILSHNWEFSTNNRFRFASVKNSEKMINFLQTLNQAISIRYFSINEISKQL